MLGTSTSYAPSSQPLDALAESNGRTAFLAGAGGCGMRGLAAFLLQSGWRVWGADQSGLASNDPLLQAGMAALPDGAAPPAVSLCIRSAAVPADQVACAAAATGGARNLLYAEMLGEISRLRPVLAVAGSHGKTTCTAWIAWALRRSGIPVGYLVGAQVPQLQGSAEWGDPSQPLILESCEYARSFHHLYPAQIALINVDAEHPDTYPGGLAEVEASFCQFLGNLQAGGQVLAGLEAPDLSASCAGAWKPVAALPEAAVIGLPGAHNRRNAALVAAVLRTFGLNKVDVSTALADFHGAARRLEELGSWQGATVISDYAHHPVEVEATLQATQERWAGRTLHVVFQPHQAQRFHAYREQFAPALDQADSLLLLEIYRTRDPAELKASVSELVPELRRRKPDRVLSLANDFAAGRSQLLARVNPGDVVLFLGAGDVDRFARRLC
jgi:UDP-N-acetylmuramate--alanine ligase